MYKSYYIEIRDSSGRLKHFFLYDCVGDVRRALQSLTTTRSIPIPGNSGPFLPSKLKEMLGYQLSPYDLAPNDIYLGNTLYSEFVPSLLIINTTRPEGRLYDIPLPIIEAARELEAARLSNGYLPGLIDCYLGRYSNLYWALLTLLLTAAICFFFADCEPLLVGLSHTSSNNAMSALACGTITVALFVHRHFWGWTPAFWLTAVAVIIIIFAYGAGESADCHRIVG